MALRFCDSFDHYDYADVAMKWTQMIAGQLDVSTITSGGRHSTNAFNFKTSQGSTCTDRICKVVPAASGTTCIVGMAIKHDNVFTSGGTSNTENADDPGATGASTILSIRYSGSTQCWFKINTSGLITAERSTTQLGTSSTGLTVGAWHYIEFKVVIDNSVGTVTVRIDGVEVLALTAQDTQALSVAAWNEIAIGSFTSITSSPLVNIWVDDLVVMDGSGSYNNAFLGDRRVAVLLPSGNGNSNMSTPLSGDRYTNVDEAAMDEDTSYVTFAAAADKDTYAFGNCPTSGATVNAVVANMAAKKVDTGEAGMAAVARISSTDYDGATKGVASSYTIQQQIWERSAVDGTTAWTTTVIDAAEFGVKKAS
jgi:hypothetical protein